MRQNRLGHFWAALAFTCAAPIAHADTVHVRAGKLVDPEVGVMLIDQRVTIVDGRITSVTAWSPPPEGGRVVDWSRYTVLPGLIDMHTHVADGYAGTSDPAEPLKHSAADSVLKGAHMARITLEAGFTTVRDVGAYIGLNAMALRNAINAGQVPGPRMFVAGSYITVPGGGGAVTGMPPGFDIPIEYRLGEVRSPNDARDRVRYMFQQGADFVKLIASGAVLAIGSKPGQLELSEAELKAACDEAAAHDSYCIAHAHGAEAIKAAIRAGARSIEHASLIDDEGIALAKAKGVLLDMDIYNGTWIEELGTKQGWPAEYLAKNRFTTVAQREGFRKAVKAGVILSYGTDAGVYPYGLNARQFPLMVQYGMTPMQAIQSATTVAAALLRKSADVGGVSAGKYGDLIAVSGDPIADIAVLQKVVGVIKGGDVVRAAN